MVRLVGLLQDFGRMAVFRRDLRTGVGWWSAPTYALFGLPVSEQAPSIADVALSIHPEDRATTLERMAAFAAAPGRHEHRFRVVRDDHRVHHIRGVWEVSVDKHGQPAVMMGVLIDDTDVVERMQAQEELNARLSEAFNLASVSVWRIDLATRRVQFNDFGYRATGVMPIDTRGIPIDEIRATIHPDDLAAVTKAANDAVACNEVIDVEARYRNPDGSYRHLITRRVAERDADGRAIALAGVSIDQTRQVAERERAQSLANRFDVITRAAGVGVWSIDLESDMVEWNEQMFLIYGIPVSATAPRLSDMLQTFVHPDDREHVDRQRRLAQQTGRQGMQFEYRIIRPDGSLRWLSTWSRREPLRDGRLMAYGVTMDVTERQLAQAQLRSLDERALLAAESAGIGTWERDVHTGAGIWDAQMYRLRGLPPDAGFTPAEARKRTHHPEDAAGLEAKFQQGVLAGKGYEHEFRVVWPDGSMRWLATRGVMKRDAAGRVDRVIGVNWDITERKRAEQAMREKAMAEQESRAKSEFVSRMSHELRTPLNAVLGFAQLLLHDAHEPLRGVPQERVQHIHEAGLHLMALIDDVLDLANIESNTLNLDMQPVSLASAFKDAVQWTQAQADAARITVRSSRPTGWVTADPRRLRQILANLLSNAIKYNRAHGQVWMDAAATQLAGSDCWQICVRDTGRGLSPEQIQHLYEPFNRLGAERDGIEGTGIGLAIVKHLVDLMGGRIDVDSEAGHGAEFRVTLVASSASGADSAQSAPDTPLDTAPAPGAQAQGELLVLYIEDNAVNVLLVEQLMGMRPAVRLITACDGTEGVAMARRALPHVLLIDMQLPDFDGFEVLRRLRDEPGLRDSTFIALSANAMPDEVLRAKEAGFDDYWTKPINFTQFLGGLDALAAERRR